MIKTKLNWYSTRIKSELKRKLNHKDNYYMNEFNKRTEDIYATHEDCLKIAREVVKC